MVTTTITPTETYDATSPYAIRLTDGCHAALQCRDNDHAKERAWDFARTRTAQVKWIRRIRNGVADKLIYGSGPY